MVTDFFKRQDDARRNTGRLVMLLAAGLLAITAVTYVLIMLVWTQVGQGGRHFEPVRQAPSFWNPGMFALVAGATTLVVLGASWVRTMQLRSGGGAGVAGGMGGREIFQGGADPDERKLMNVVEEMSIASATPMPRVFVMDDEEGINAFAAGWAPDSAVICVTRGAITGLSRDQLQGVVAHEFSHILNGDMRMNIRLMGLGFGLLALAIVGRLLLQMGSGGRSSSSRKGDGTAALALIGLVVLVMGYVGAFFGQLMQAAISRQREFLADASAVQFTRNPEGLAGALKQIGASGCQVHSSHSKEAGHMFFGSSATHLTSLLATHPPLEERIRRLDPAWDGALPAPRVFQGKRAGYRADGLRVGRPGVSPLPEGAGDPGMACAVACALLLDRQDARVRAAQIGGDARLSQAADMVLGIAEDGRLAALEECLAALRKLPPGERQRTLARVEAVLAEAPHPGLHEWAVHRILRMALIEAVPLTGQGAAETTGGAALALSVLAHAGSRNASAVKRAFAAGAAKMGLSKEALVPAETCRFPDLDAALDALRQGGDSERQRMMEAAVAVSNSDGRLIPVELLLMRAYGLSLAV